MHDRIAPFRLYSPFARLARDAIEQHARRASRRLPVAARSPLGVKTSRSAVTRFSRRIATPPPSVGSHPSARPRPVRVALPAIGLVGDASIGRLTQLRALDPVGIRGNWLRVVLQQQTADLVSFRVTPSRPSTHSATSAKEISLARVVRKGAQMAKCVDGDRIGQSMVRIHGDVPRLATQTPARARR